MQVNPEARKSIENGCPIARPMCSVVPQRDISAVSTRYGNSDGMSAAAHIFRLSRTDSAAESENTTSRGIKYSRAISLAAALAYRHSAFGI